MSDRPTAKQRERVHEIVDSTLDLYHPKVKIVTKANKKIMTIEADINDYKVEKMKNFKGSDLEMVLTAWAFLLPIGVLFVIAFLGAINK